MKLTKSISSLIFLLFCTQAFAGSTGLNGFDLSIAKGATDGNGILNIHQTKVLAPWQWAFAFQNELTHGLLAATNPVTGQSIRVIDNLYSSNISAAVGLPRHFDVGLQIPVAVFEQGTNFNTQNSFETSALMDIPVQVKWNPVEENTGHPGISILGQITLPTGSREKFTGYGTVTSEGKVIVDKKIGPLSLSANVGYQVLPRTHVAGMTMDDRLTFGGAATFAIPAGDRSWELMAAINGYAVPSQNREITTPVAWIGGLGKKFRNGVSFQAAGGKGITGGVGAGEWRIFTNLFYQFHRKEKMERLVESIYFPFNKDRYHPRHGSQIIRASNTWAENKKQTVRLNGFTDNTGAEKYNTDLAKKRAEYVAKQLLKQGVPKSRIEIESHGAENPAEDNCTFSGKAKNRRVEIYLGR